MGRAPNNAPRENHLPETCLMNVSGHCKYDRETTPEDALTCDGTLLP
ncbi:MAG: hypothetical protein HY036_08520 [Nitrospirae bacterium]|nr:hypothetical protein [Nitrospirota bacterium]MBI3352609.1 hypothetical protein [Nitrospirota bacterium]